MQDSTDQQPDRQEGFVSHMVRAIDQGIDNATVRMQPRPVGRVTQISNSIARVSGLDKIGFDELLLFPGNLYGIAVDLTNSDIGVALLGPSEHVVAGDEVTTTGRQPDIGVGQQLLGRVINGNGMALDGGPLLSLNQRQPIERDAPAIMDRAAVTVALQSGIKSIDALIPIGRGQRELIVGDRQTGKTSIALNAIINQRDTGVICLYCAIGQRNTAVAEVINTLKQHNAMTHSLVIVASGEDPPGLQYITPYAAMAIAEFFMFQGRDVLLILDDLTRHGRAYRELSLLLRRPPGREAYPGDIFYIHSRLLERATHLRTELGGGSLTCLPIVELQAGDISAYIPTNLISITDGQILLSPSLAKRGLLPAVDVGLSVSRVGGKTQLPAYRKVAGDLRLFYAQFLELETFSRFGTRLDATSRDIIARGERVRASLQQEEYSCLPVADQIAVLYATTSGLLDAISVDTMSHAEQLIRLALVEQTPQLAQKLASTTPLTDEDWHQLQALITTAVSRLIKTKPEESDHGEPGINQA